MWRQRKYGMGFQKTEILNYKGYNIKIQLSSISNIPSQYTIIKNIDGRGWNLRNCGFAGCSIVKLTKLATDYIDNFPGRLEDKLKKLIVSTEATKRYDY